MKDTYLFIPSYHRPDNIKTVRLFQKLGWDMSHIVVFIDNETDDIDKYQKSCNDYGCKLHIFDMCEARERYDYIHRPSKSLRSAGQARNMMQDYAKENNIDFYVVQDDDSNNMQRRFPLFDRNGKNIADGECVGRIFDKVEDFMRKLHIGVFALPQTGDFIGGVKPYTYIRKVMNTTFYLLPYIYRGERGVQDDDTSMFVGIWNNGLFTGSTGCGLSLLQTMSATQKGGLTDLYEECKLLNKSLVTPIQYPSAIKAGRQKGNGNRLHHRINYKYIAPMIMKSTDGRDNIAWDTYIEDFPFTNEPKLKRNGTR
jgi:hypothetical protein